MLDRANAFDDLGALLDESPQFFVRNRDGRLNMQSALILKAFDTVFIITMKPEFHDSPGKPTTLQLDTGANSNEKVRSGIKKAKKAVSFETACFK